MRCSPTRSLSSPAIAARAARTKARILSGSFSPGARSTPEETSTPGARVMRSASATLPASSPPESMNGTLGSRFSSSSPVEALAEAARPCRLARRAGVEDAAGRRRRRRPRSPRGRLLLDRRSPSSPAGRISSGPRQRAPAVSLPWSCSRSGLSASMLAAEPRRRRHRPRARPSARGRARARRARARPRSRDGAATAERTRSRRDRRRQSSATSSASGVDQATDFDQQGHSWRGSTSPLRFVLPFQAIDFTEGLQRLTPPAAGSRSRGAWRTRSTARRRFGRGALPLQRVELRRATRAPAPGPSGRRGATCPAAARRRCRPTITARDDHDRGSARTAAAGSTTPGWPGRTDRARPCTVSRFATAKAIRTIASGTRISAETILRIMACVRVELWPAMPTSRRSATVEPLAHFLAGLEERHRFLVDRHVRAGARIAPGAGRPVLDREGAEAAQLDPVAARHRGDDLIEDGVDDVLDVALIEMRVLRRRCVAQARI